MIHAPSLIALIVSLGLAVLALIYGYFFAPAGTLNATFWMAIAAYVVAAGSAFVKK